MAKSLILQTFSFALLCSVITAWGSPERLVKLETKTLLDSGLANIHLTWTHRAVGSYFFTYGPCDSKFPREAHHHVGHSSGGPLDQRLVWLIPEDADSDGCLSAWSQDSRQLLVGRSAPLRLQKTKGRWPHSLRKRASEVSVAMNNGSGIDSAGPWFDGVALVKEKQMSAVNVEEAKSKKIAIVGAGMSGLMTFLNLHLSGFTNVEIIEAGQRLGGRVHTAYLEGGPFDYQYQEMGPMRFPESITYASTNETLQINDHRIVFQLADVMNDLNGHSQNLSVDFIPWLQTNPNGLRYFDGIRKPDGTVPNLADIKTNASLASPATDDPTLDEVDNVISNITSDPEFMAKMAENVYQAHKTWLEAGLDGLGGDEWSEFAYIHNYLGFSLNITDQALGGSGDRSFWTGLYDAVYFSATKWRTIDGGLNRLPLSFHPLVDNATIMNRKIERVTCLEDCNQVQLSWKNNFMDLTWQNSTYDFAIVAAPFSVVRRWRLPSFSPTLSSAIAHVPYTPACKVALQFATRFWEHFAQPIHGGCSTSTDIPGIGTICYPSYNLDASGPGVMLASYSSTDWGARLASLTDAEHVQYVLNAMVEIHGEIAREQYTGRFDRRCWILDPFESAAWASPTVGQHKLYMPSYFQTENHMIFVGEHTSYTHAWIASALESGVRGSVQLLLELGLVDEAKMINKKWMARWMNV